MRTTSTETPGDLSPKQHLRVHTFGCFQIEWVDPETGQVTPLPPERLRGQNAGSALGLLKALLSCPDRFATRAWLNEQFWPSSRHRSAEERLNDVVSSLRTLLRPKGSTEMLVHFVYGTSGRGAGFRLDSYSQLWCDADAFEWYVKHALLLDQRGQDSTACWEHAFVLAERGQYLPEQVYEEWAGQKREYLNGLVRDCIHHWTALLRHMGHVDEAIMRLRAYWLEHLTDEDTLRPLLELLGEQERFQEAEEYYTRTQAVLAEDNHALDARTAETIESIRALQVSRRSSQHQPSVPLSPSSSSSLKAFFTNHLDHFQGRMLSQSYSGEQHLKHSRRQVLSSMVTSAYTMLTLSPYLLLSSEKQEPFLAAFYGTHPLNRTIVADLGEITKKYWKLSTNLSVPLLSGLQGHFQSIMHLLKAPHASVVRPELFSLASEAAQLLGKTLCDLRDYSLALSYYSFAVTAALEAKNNDLRAVALGRIALLFLSLQQPRQALACLQETRNTQSLKIRSWCAAIEAEAYSCVSESELCQHSLETARYAAEEVFSEADPYATGFTASRFASYEGACYLRFNQPEKALPILQRAITSVEPASIRRQSRLLTYEGMAFLLLGEASQAYLSLSQSLDLTLQTQSLDVLHHIQLLSNQFTLEGSAGPLKDLCRRIQETQRAITRTGDLYE